MTFNRLRHSYASISLRAGAPLKIVSESFFGVRRALSRCAQSGAQPGPIPASSSRDVRVTITRTAEVASSMTSQLRASGTGWLK